MSVLLSVVDLENKPDYECVSYTWGDAGDEEEISVDAEKVLIRRHLWEALRRMRLSVQPRLLWIDALCISQSDLDEKAQQVHMIGKIVHHASRVLAWLGEHADGSEAILHGWPAEETVTTNMSLESIPLDLCIRRLESWLAFCSRRWFSRTWIIQEVVVAKDVHVFCGKDVGHWTTLFEDRLGDSGIDGLDIGLMHDAVKGVSPTDLFRKVVAVLSDDLIERYNVKVQSLGALIRTRSRYQGRNDLPVSRGFSFELFSSNVITSKCLDRRDKIYALRSIIYGPSVEPSHGIPVDYTIECVELLIRSLDFGIFSGTYPYLARNLIKLLELSDDEVEAVVDRVASQPALLNRSRLTVLAYVCITDARTPEEVTSRLLGLSGNSSRWLYKDFWKPGCTENLLRWHSVRKAGGDMYSLLEYAATSNP